MTQEHVTLFRKKKAVTETLVGPDEGLTHKDFKVAITGTFKELWKTMFKDLKEKMNDSKITQRLKLYKSTNSRIKKHSN
jgi:hypothetical protein